MSTPNAQHPAPQTSRMSSSMLRSPLKSPKRRVLGTLTSNAKVSPAKHQVSGDTKAKTMGGTSPLKQQQVAPVAPMTSPTKASNPSPVVAGKKRSFDEINGTLGGDATPLSKRLVGRDALSVEKRSAKAAARAPPNTVYTCHQHHPQWLH